jgi:IS605 OrfB family transposase
MDSSDSLNQRLHHWPYRKIINMIKYKGALAGIEVKDNIDERNTEGAGRHKWSAQYL